MTQHPTSIAGLIGRLDANHWKKRCARLHVGRSEYQKCLDVIEGCSRIALARRGL